MNNEPLSERGMPAKFTTPTLHKLGRDEPPQIREELSFTQGCIIALANPPFKLPCTAMHWVSSASL